MKKSLFALVIAVCIAFAGLSVVYAEDITYDFTDGVLTISGNGAMIDYESASDYPWGTYRKDITRVVIDEGVTCISAKAFYACTSLTSVEISSTVTAVGVDAFARCQKLADVRIHQTEEKWMTAVLASGNDYLTGATTIYNAEGVYDYGTWFFDGVDTLTITSNEERFYGVLYSIPWKDYEEQIKHIILKGNITTIGRYAMANLKADDIELPDTVTTLEVYAFANSGIKNVSLPESVTDIGSKAFEYSAVESVYIPEKVKNIAGRFEFCDQLSNITVSENNPYLTSVDGNLYSKDMTTLYRYAPAKQGSSFTIPDTVVTCQILAFDACHLSEVIIPASVEQISLSGTTNRLYTKYNYYTNIVVHEDNAVYTSVDGCLFSKDKSTLVQYAGSSSEYIVPYGTITIGADAFSNCRISKIVLPDSVTTIGSDAFEKCSVKELHLPASVTEISYSAIKCPQLTDIYYGGTEAEWTALKLPYTVYDGQTITIHFSEPSTATISKLSCDANNIITAVVTCSDEQNNVNPILAIYDGGLLYYMAFLDNTECVNEFNIKVDADVNMQGEFIVKVFFIDTETLTPYGTPAKVGMINY